MKKTFPILPTNMSIPNLLYLILLYCNVASNCVILINCIHFCTSLPMGLPDVCNATTKQQYYTRLSFVLPIQRSVKQKNRKRIRAIIISITARGFFFLIGCYALRYILLFHSKACATLDAIINYFV